MSEPTTPTDALKAEMRTAISSAYYDSRDEGQTMEVAADRAAEAALHRVLRSDVGAWFTPDSLAEALTHPEFSTEDENEWHWAGTATEFAAAIIAAAKEAERDE